MIAAALFAPIVFQADCTAHDPRISCVNHAYVMAVTSVHQGHLAVPKSSARCGPAITGSDPYSRQQKGRQSFAMPEMLKNYAKTKNCL
jgi:hypothetical protein